MLLKKELEEKEKMKNKDYIYREDVLKLFCGTCLWENDCFGNNGDEPCERYKTISSLPTYDIESKWILTKDALPTEDGVYFLYYKSLGELVVGHGYFSSDLKKFGEPISVYNCEKSDWEDSFDEYQCEVIAWMAVPELPEVCIDND